MMNTVVPMNLDAKIKAIVLAALFVIVSTAFPESILRKTKRIIFNRFLIGFHQFWNGTFTQQLNQINKLEYYLIHHFFFELNQLDFIQIF